MLFLAVLVAALLAVRLAGGRFEQLATLSLRGWELVVAALLVQILTISVLVDPPHLLATSLHLLSYVLAGAFLWRNRAVPGLLVAAGGGALNLLAIAANGGVMPASAQALRSAGLATDGPHFVNSTVVADPQLAFLGDVFAVPAAAGQLANVFSVGDLVLAFGAVYVVHAAAGCRWTGGRGSSGGIGSVRSAGLRQEPAARPVVPRP